MSKWFTIILVALMAISLTACGGGKTCDSGTVAAGGKCVPACDNGQSWDGTACVDGTVCAAGTHLENGECVSDITGCAAGTELVNGQCVPACADGEYYNVANDACEPIPECGTGTTWNPATAQCEPDVVCAVGTHEEGGECVPDVICGADTHPENGECVPNVLPDPDVPEAAEPNDILYGGVEAQFELAAEGEMVSLGGTVGMPADLDDDGIADADWDSFVFAANAGTYLEIMATSEGATLPAFAVWGVDDEGYIVYDRWALNPNGIDTTRRVYLPIDGVYIIQVSDYANALAHPFGFGMDSIPTGGDQFTYYMTVETLPAPAITDVDTIPNLFEGNFDTYDVAAYNLVGLSADDIVNVFAPGQPLADTPNDVIVSVMMFDSTGAYMGSMNADSPDGDAAGWLPAQADGDYMVVVDYWVMLGNARQFALALDYQPVLDCAMDDCTNVNAAEGELIMAGFDVLQFDHFAAAVNPTDGTFDAVMFLLDNNLEVVASADGGYEGDPEGLGMMLLDGDMRLYVAVYDYYGAPGTFEINVAVNPTDEVVAGTPYTGTAIDMPVGHPDGAIGAAHLAVTTPGQIAYFQAPAGDAGWGTMGADAGRYGVTQNFVHPYFDPFWGMMWVFSNNPTFPVTEALDFEYNVISWDGNDVSGLTYDVGYYLLDPIALGAVVYGAPVDLPGQVLVAGADATALTFDAMADTAYLIEITPTAASELAPAAQVYHRWFWDMVEGLILFDAAGDRFIRMDEFPTEAGIGEAISFEQISIYDGELTVLLENTNAGAADTTFDVHIEAMLCLAGSSQCNGDDVEICPAGDAWVVDMTCPDGCEENEDGAAFCTPQCDPATYENECDGNGDLQFCDAMGLFAITDCRIGCEVVADGADICTPECDPVNDAPICNADDNLETCVDQYWVVTPCLAGCDDSAGDAVCIVPGDTCADAIDLDGLLPFASMVDSTNNTDANGSTDTDCTGYTVAGHDIFWSVTLAEGDTLSASMNPNPYFDAAIYLYAGGCPGIGTCVIGDDSGNPEEFVYTVPAGAGGVYYIVTDGWGGSGYGMFDFTVEVY